MKESSRNTKSKDELSENNKEEWKCIDLKKYIFLFCVSKMVVISDETFAKNFIHTISQLKRSKESILWLRIKDIGRELEVKNIFDLVD